MIDCGSSTFRTIKKNNLLEDVESIHVLVTHTHADHVGSLADLILYSYYSHGKFAEIKLLLFSPRETKIKEMLRIMGVVEGVHYLYYSNPKRQPYVEDVLINTHVKEISSYGYLLNINDSKIYYSGDTNTLPESIVSDIKSGKIDYAYIDTCKADYEGNVHLSLRKLEEEIDSSFRGRVYCMHLDEGFDIEEAERMGFNVVKNEF